MSPFEDRFFTRLTGWSAMANTQRQAGWRFDGSADAPALGLGAVVAVLVAVSLWATLVAQAAQFGVRALDVPGALVVVSGAASLLGLAGGALAYARYRDIDLRLGRPRSGSWPVAAGAALAPAALVGAAALVTNVAFGVPLSSALNRFVSPDASVSFLAWTMGVPSAFLGIGLGLLFCALVPERVRSLVGERDAAAVAALLVGFFRLLPIDAVGVRLSVGGAVEFTATLVFGVAFAMAVGVLLRRTGAGSGVLDTDALERRHLAVLALALVGVVGVATGLTSAGELVREGLWVAAFALAIVGYERTRSVWVPVLAMVGFTLALDAVVYAEALAGVSAI